MPNRNRSLTGSGPYVGESGPEYPSPPDDPPDEISTVSPAGVVPETPTEAAEAPAEVLRTAYVDWKGDAPLSNA